MDIREALPDEQRRISPQAEGVGELLRLLLKTQKALRLYQAGNAITDRLEREVFTRLSAHLEELGPLRLTVREFQILWNEDIVYESRDRNDSLAFLFFRDGIRWLSIQPGVEMKEFRNFLQCLSRVAVLSDNQDDLVTLFWEQDFKAIRYFAIDELSLETTGLSLEEQLAAGSLEAAGGGDASGGAGDPSDAVSLKDLEQPVSQLPVDASRLSDGEIEALRAEVTGEDADPLYSAIVELAIELTLQETSGEERQKVADHLVAIVKRFLANGDLEAASGSVEHLTGLSEMLFRDSEPVRKLCAHLLGALAEPGPLARFLEQAERRRSMKPAELTAYLARLGPDALPHLIPLMSRPTTPVFRRAVSEAVLAAGEHSLEPMSRHLTSDDTVLDPDFLREALHVLSHLPEERVLPLIEVLLGAEDFRIRRETALALGRFKEERVDDICLHLLEEKDPELRAEALDILVRHGRRAYARPLLDRAVGARDFADRSLPEKRRIFAAVAKLAGEEALDWFMELLRPQRRRWFATRKEREVMEAAAHGIRMIGTDTTSRLLRDLVGSGNRLLKAACLKELSERRT